MDRLMKFLADFLPVFLFFGVYWATQDIFLATKALMILMVIQTLYYWVRYKTVPAIQLASLGLVLVLGLATLYFKNTRFIMWKPTLLYWAMSLGLLVSLYFKKNALQYLLGKELILTSSVWKKLNVAWMGFFFLMGALNLIVAYSFSEAIWVNFKVFGCLGLTLLFLVLQAVFLLKNKK